jgi:hypothetical protein
VSIEAVRELAGRLAVSTKALGALGAALCLRHSGQQASPEVEAFVDARVLPGETWAPALLIVGRRP